MCRWKIYTILEQHVPVVCVDGTFTKVEMNQFKLGRGHLRTSCTHEYTNTYKEQNFIRIAAVKWCLVSK